MIRLPLTLALAASCSASFTAAPTRCALSTAQVLDRLVPDHIQHNPFAATRRQVAIDFPEPFFKANPQARYTVQRTIVSGDTAVVHNEADLGGTLGRNAMVDIFRVKDCRIVEHRDVIQPVPTASANANGMCK